MGDPETGQQTQLATCYLPTGLAAELPVLAARDTGPGGIYDRMEEAGLGPIGGSNPSLPAHRHLQKPAASG